MGYNVILIAITGKDPAAIHRDYGVTPTEQYWEDHGDSRFAPVCAAVLPSGAYLLYINDDPIPPNPAMLARLSENGALMACALSENVTFSALHAYTDGKQIWSIIHDPEQSSDHLQITGTPPPEFIPIRDHCFAKQASATDTDHIFSIPVDLFAALGGMRYDEILQTANPKPWRELRRITPPAGCSPIAWLKRIGL